MDKNIVLKLHKIALEQGYDYSSRQCIEEMSELIQALNKLWRYEQKYLENFHDGDSKELENMLITNVIEEIADVSITIENLKYLLAIPDSKINDAVKQKIDKYYRIHR